MMNILCVSATELEIAPFLKARPAADFLVSGVGAPSTIYQLVKRLQQIDYDLVIQAGIAGSFTASRKLGEVVFVKQDCFADLGISEHGNFFTLFEKGFSRENEIPYKRGWLKNAGLMMDLFPIEKVRGITVNNVTDDRMVIKQWEKKFRPQVESMEGAALHYVCLQEKVPFLQLRSISNFVGERNKEKWKMKDAVKNLNQTLLKIVDHLLPGDCLN